MPSLKIICLLVLKKKFFKGFCYLLPWRPSWSCDLDHFYKLSFSLTKNAPHDVWLCLVSEKKIFAYYGNIQVYCPGEGSDLPLGSILFSFQNHKSSVHLPISIDNFPHSNAWATYFDLAVKYSTVVAML